MYIRKHHICFYADHSGIALGFLKSKTAYYVDFNLHDIWFRPRTEYQYQHSDATVKGWLIFRKAIFTPPHQAQIIPFPDRRCSNE